MYYKFLTILRWYLPRLNLSNSTPLAFFFCFGILVLATEVCGKGVESFYENFSKKRQNVLLDNYNFFPLMDEMVVDGNYKN